MSTAGPSSSLDTVQPAGPLRDHGPARRGRHGRGLPRPRHAARPRRRDQGAAAAARRQPAVPRALRARGEERLRASTTRTSARSTTSAARRQGDELTTWCWSWSRASRSRSGSPRGRCRCRRCCASARRSPTRSTRAHRAGHRPPRPEARQRHARRESGAKLLDFGLARATGARVSRRSRSHVVARTPTAQPLTAAGHDRRHVPVHGARAARGPGGRRAHRHLRARRRALRDGRRDAARSRARRARSLIAAISRSRAAADLDRRRRMSPAGARPRGAQVPGEGPRRPLAERARRRGRARSGSPRAARGPGCPGSSRRGGGCARGWPGRSPRSPDWPRSASPSAWDAARAAARARSCASRSRTPRRPGRRPAGALARRAHARVRRGRRRREEGASGCARSTRSSRGRSRAPKARCARSGRPTAARSRSCPAGSCAAWPWPEGRRRRSATRSTAPTASWSPRGRDPPRRPRQRPAVADRRRREASQAARRLRTRPRASAGPAGRRSSRTAPLPLPRP